VRHAGLVNGTSYYYAVSARNANGESAPSAERSASPADGPGSGDPLFDDQWHLVNTGQAGASPGEDINVQPAWDAGLRGEGIRIVIVDDGLEIEHEDLLANIATGQSHNYLDGGTDPTGGRHGTAVAGILAARDRNDLGLRGAAPRANLAGYNLLTQLLDSNQADAMLRHADQVHISVNSWGEPDDANLHPASQLWQDAILTGLANGRGGLGTIYLWAGGNGAEALDNANYDGHANHRGVLAVCAVDDEGKQASYSEPGANLLVCGPSQEHATSGHGISTTDRSGAEGFNSNGTLNYADTAYHRNFTGTSAATPAVAGVVALLLQANPTLGWRDVRLLLASTARRNDPQHADWTLNGAGHWVNHAYGFGVADAHAAVTAAATWSNVAPQRSHALDAAPMLAIPDDDAGGVSDTLTVTASGIGQIEHVEVHFSAPDHPFSGDLEITLINETTGTRSRLASVHSCPGFQCRAYDAWAFGTLRHLGESADGDWTLSVVDAAAQDVGTFESWGLVFHGR
jgi:kexin